MRRRDIRALVVIWVLVFAAAFVLAAMFADDDPATDDAAGAGALAGIVGTVLSGIYLYWALDVRPRRERRIEQPSVPSTAAPAAPAEGTFASLKRNRRQVVLALALWTAAAVSLAVAGVSAGYAVWIAGLLPLAVLLYLHHRSA